VDSRYKSFARRQTTLVTPFMLLAVLLVLSAARGPDLFTANGLDGAMIGAAPLVLGTLAITTIAIAGPAGVDLSIGPAMTLINIRLSSSFQRSVLPDLWQCLPARSASGSRSKW
jgi:ribose/xylose/arabinose/galactoside ABC-type transport system permease subunit